MTKNKRRYVVLNQFYQLFIYLNIITLFGIITLIFNICNGETSSLSNCILYVS